MGGGVCILNIQPGALQYGIFLGKNQSAGFSIHVPKSFESWQSDIQAEKTEKQPTLLVVILHSDDLTTCGSGTGQDGRGIQGLDGERVNHTDVVAYGNSLENITLGNVH